MIAPVLFASPDASKLSTTIDVYFPPGSWISCDDFTTVYSWKN